MNDDITLIPVPFRGDTLYLAQHRGESYVPMRPLVGGMGLAWQAQRRKLTDLENIDKHWTRRAAAPDCSLIPFSP